MNENINAEILIGKTKIKNLINRMILTTLKQYINLKGSQKKIYQNVISNYL